MWGHEGQSSSALYFAGELIREESNIEKTSLLAAPNPDQVAAAVREVEQLRGAQRLAFIESVSAAAQTLSADQITIARSLPYSGAP